MSKQMDELNKVNKDLYAEQTKALTGNRDELAEQSKKQQEERVALQKKHREAGKEINDKIIAARKVSDARQSLEHETKRIYNSLISGLANDKYDTKEILEQAEKEAELLVQ